MAAESKPANPVEEALRAIADGAPVPWRALESSAMDPGQIEALHLLDDVAHGYRAEAPSPAPHREVLLRWGALEAESLIGEGSFGEVYRAFDPWLGRHVALKLFRASGSVGAGLDEARRLARLRHRNVLSVYGCAVHDGRAGLWSELIEGRTLAAIVADDGAFSAEEGLRIGRDLAQALAVVHEADLVHGDVKAENVMRERSSRIVLMDFGAGGEQRLLAGQRLISGTPRYLPPEVLDGAPLSMQSDIYALGVLLFFLLSGRHPYAETDAAALREAQLRGAQLHLKEVRSELDPALCTLIERCIATDPAQRPSSARALDASLSALSPVAALKAPTGRRLPLAALVAACAALLAVATLLAWPRIFPPAWDSTAKFLRVEPSGNVEIAADSTLRIGDRLRLNLHSSRDAYVYVLNEDDAGNATVLFPSATASARNPLQHGMTLQLPGGDNSTLAWEVTADSAREEFVVVAALQPLPEMDAELAGWQHAVAANADTRAVGAIVSAPDPLLRGEHLRRILAGLARDPAHVRVWQYSFAHRS
ncbi:serine/threonine-protein kinase [Dokdonella soli]|uniref:Protein kinase domain-containing protein n=1 Tax=Dokdonella soli TaxID=529810 RepID=A0ABP3U2N7_9GAMM